MHRNIWGSALSQCQSGIVRMYSCSTDEGAEETPDAGGLYTSLLIRYANMWYNSAETNTYYTTYNAHKDAKSWMENNAPQQTPIYEPSFIVFPFAVKYSM